MHQTSSIKVFIQLTTSISVTQLNDIIIIFSTVHEAGIGTSAALYGSKFITAQLLDIDLLI